MWVKEISVFRILFNNDAQQISFNSGKNGPENGTETWLLAKKKMHNEENTFEVA